MNALCWLVGHNPRMARIPRWPRDRNGDTRIWCERCNRGGVDIYGDESAIARIRYALHRLGARIWTRCDHCAGFVFLFGFWIKGHDKCDPIPF